MTKRVLITPEYLIRLYGDLDPKVIALIFAGFIEKTDKAALAYFKAMADDLRRRKNQDRARKEAIEMWELFHSAYSKMSVFERDRVRRDLPKALVLHLLNRESKKE